MALHESLISPTANPALQQALEERMAKRAAISGGFGQLEALAVRLGLVQNTLTPRFRDPTLTLFAADHGLAVNGIEAPFGKSTHELVMQALQGRLPVAVMARLHGLQLQVVDCGVAQELPPHPKLTLRKLAHGTRNSRSGPAMTRDQVQAALRIGMEWADSLSGNVVLFSGLGQASNESAALVLARLDAVRVDSLLPAQTTPATAELLHQVLNRHRDTVDAMDVLAHLGGFEMAVMVGALLVGASKRHLLVIDGLAACAALRVAASIAAPVTDYALFCRSHHGSGIDVALQSFQAGALLELGLSSLDGLGAALSWSMVRSAAALLSDVHEPAAAPTPMPAIH